MKKPHSRKKKKSNWPFILIFLLGLGVFLYPQISRMYYAIDAVGQVASFEKGRKELSEEELARRMALAAAYNASLRHEVPEDPYSKEQKESGRAAYARMLEIHEKIGHVRVPAIGIDLPIYAGTSEEVLQKGIGHLEGTSLPIGGPDTHTVLAGHSALPTAKLFTDLDKVKVGHRFFIYNVKEVLAYEVDAVQVIKPDDFSLLLIQPGEDRATLLTCTPPTINTHRLLVMGHRVPYVEEEAEAPDERAFLDRYGTLLAAVGVPLLLLLVLLVLLIRRRRRSKQKEADDAHLG